MFRFVVTMAYGSAVALQCFAAMPRDHELLRPGCESSGTPIRRLAPDMFDTLILLSGPAEHSVFATLLRSYNPLLNVLPVFTAADLDAIEPEWLSGARLVSFGGDVKVPAAVVAQLGYGAYNFHPGSPRYPGDTPVQDAIDEGASDFGCTMHRVTERAEAGPIVEVDLFAVPPGASIGALEEMIYAALVQMFWRMARPLATQSAPLIERAVRWSEVRRSRFDDRQIRRGVPMISRDRAVRRVDGPFTEQFGIAPSIVPQGPQLRLVSSDIEIDVADAVDAEA